VKPRLLDEAADKSKNSKLAEITDITQCRSLRLPDTLPAGKVARLIYTNSGAAVLALSSNAVHKLWKWLRNDRNPSGKHLKVLAIHFPGHSKYCTATVAASEWNPYDK